MGGIVPGIRGRQVRSTAIDAPWARVSLGFGMLLCPAKWQVNPGERGTRREEPPALPSVVRVYSCLP